MTRFTLLLLAVEGRVEVARRGRKPRREHKRPRRSGIAGISFHPPWYGVERISFPGARSGAAARSSGFEPPVRLTALCPEEFDDVEIALRFPNEIRWSSVLHAAHNAPRFSHDAHMRLTRS
jgi:hypothetical protein